MASLAHRCFILPVLVTVNLKLLSPAKPKINIALESETVPAPALYYGTGTPKQYCTSAFTVLEYPDLSNPRQL
ncbi:hypothetical protein HOY80DRAFT_988514, partial [Tuber brumale]